MAGFRSTTGFQFVLSYDPSLQRSGAPPRTTNDLFRFAITKLFSNYEQKRNDKDAENRCCDHPAEYWRAYRVTSGRARAGRNHKREQSKDEGKARHHHRAKTQRRGLDRSRVDVFSEPSLLDGESNNQNAVLGGERDERYQADLGIHVEAQPCDLYCRQRA